MAKPKPRPIDVEIYDQKYTIVLQSSLKEADVRADVRAEALPLDKTAMVFRHLVLSI